MMMMMTVMDNESDSDNKPYWQVSLNTKSGRRAYVNKEYEYEENDEKEDEDEDDEGYYAEPAYEAYPVE